MNKNFWKIEETNYLTKNFDFNSNIDLAAQLNRSVYSISKKAQKLNLKKNEHYMSELVFKKNDNNIIRIYYNNRNLDYNKLKQIALKCKTRYEFQKFDPRAYALCIKKKILNDVCSHMLNKKYSIPQLLLFEILKILFPNTQINYNNRKLIRPYEIDIYIEDYNLGFEYNGKYWHNKYHNNDDLKINLCNENNINLIVINENSKSPISDIKCQLINNLNKINNICKTSLKDTDILNINERKLFNLIKKNIINVKDIKLIVNKYKYFSDFRKNEYKTYEMLVRYRLLNKYTNHLIRKSYMWNINKIINIINKYNNYSDFTKENICCYKYIKAHNLEYLLTNLHRNEIKWDTNMVTNIVSKYNNYSDFIRENLNCYKAIKKHKWEYLLSNLKRKNIINWNFDLIKNLIIDNNYNNISELRRNYNGAYKFIKRNKLTQEYNNFIQKQNEKT